VLHLRWLRATPEKDSQSGLPVLPVKRRARVAGKIYVFCFFLQS
jgi:hypothetical protein